MVFITLLLCIKEMELWRNNGIDQKGSVAVISPEIIIVDCNTLQLGAKMCTPKNLEKLNIQFNLFVQSF